MNKTLLFVVTSMLLFYAVGSLFNFEETIPNWLGFVLAALSVIVLVFLWIRIYPFLNDSNEAIGSIVSPVEPLSIAESVRRHEYLDKLTKLGNRSFFDARMDVLLVPARLSGEGALAIISLSGLEKVQHQDKLNSTQQGIVVEAAVLIENSIVEYSDAIIARISSLEFAVIVHPVSKNQNQKIAKKIEKALTQLQLPVELNDGNFFHIGITSFNSESSRFELLANVDLALRSAQLKGGSGWHQLDLEIDNIAWGMVQWRTFFEKTISSKTVELYLQPVLDLETRELVHSEVFARLKDHNGRHIFANEFIPMAAACGVLPQIDRLVVDSLIKWYLIQPKSNQRLCLNLSIDSLLDEVFIDWLIQRLAVKQNLYSKFIIEIPERPSLQPDGKISRMLNKLNLSGIEVGVDHVGEQMVDLAYLEWFPINYLKIHQSIIYSISNEQHHHHELLIQSLAKVAETKNFLLLAEGIERESQIELLGELGISAGQGFYLGTPYKLDFDNLGPRT